MIKVGISDCDHKDIKEEQIVFEKNGYEVVLHQCHTEEELINEMQEYSVIGNQYAPFTEKVFAKLPNLKCIVRYGVGLDHIDLEAASRHGVAICNVPDYGIQEVASHALALMMALSRKIITMNNSVRNGTWKYELSIPIYRFNKITIGIIGIGRIGKCFAELIRGLNCRIIACDPIYNKINRKYPDCVEMVEMDELLKESDIISIHTPLETSKGMISEKELKQMKRSAYIINVSRGGIIVEEDLVKALENGWIAGAACDVLSKEPPTGDHPLFKFDNFICTPHMAWYSEQASSDLKTKLAEEMVRYLKGDPLRNQINKL